MGVTGRKGHSRYTGLQRKRLGAGKVLPKVNGKGLGTPSLPRGFGEVSLAHLSQGIGKRRRLSDRLWHPKRVLWLREP